MAHCVYVMHRWGKDNKCVGCRRWQPGFAPKKAPSKDRAECQVCERQWALLGTILGHHGYQRPGCGYIVGDCYGQGYAPFPATDALERWMKTVLAHVEDMSKLLQELPTKTEVSFNHERRRKASFERGDYETVISTTTYRNDGFKKTDELKLRTGRSGQKTEGTWQSTWNLRSWEEAVGRKASEYTQELQFWMKERDRVAARIAKGIEMRAAGESTTVVMKPAEVPSAKSL